MIYTNEDWHSLTRSNRFNLLLELAMVICIAQSQNKAPRGEREWDKVSNDFKAIYGMAKHLYCDGRAIRDPEHIDFLSNYKLDLYQTHQNIDQTKELEQVANDWLNNYVSLGKNFKLLPMPSTYNAVVEFALRHKEKQIKIHKEEYWNNSFFTSNNIDIKYFNDPSDITNNDCVVISLPLKGTYKMPDWIDALFERCNHLGVPVFVDICWAWLQHSFFLNLDHACVDTVTCTLSKLFPISGFNQGFKFLRTSDVTHYQELYSANRFGAKILSDIMKKFPADHIAKKYKDKQTFWCNKLNLQPSNCVYHAELTEDLLWYCENKRLAIDGVSQKVFNLVPLFENHDLLVDYLT